MTGPAMVQLVSSEFRKRLKSYIILVKMNSVAASALSPKFYCYEKGFRRKA